MNESDFRLLASALRFVKAGSIEVSARDSKSLIVSVKDDVIDLDFQNPELFSTSVKRKGLLESLQEAKDLGRALAESEITISFSRRSKPVLKVGRQAKPSLSRLVTRSKEIQVLSVKELRALDKELLRQKD
jgi:hypothetical protein